MHEPWKCSVVLHPTTFVRILQKAKVNDIYAYIEVLSTCGKVVMNCGCSIVKVLDMNPSIRSSVTACKVLRALFKSGKVNRTSLFLHDPPCSLLSLRFDL